MNKANSRFFDLVFRAGLYNDSSYVALSLVDSVDSACSEDDFNEDWRYQASCAGLFIGDMRLRIEQLALLLSEFETRPRSDWSERVEMQLLDMFAGENFNQDEMQIFMRELCHYSKKNPGIFSLRLACLDAAEYITHGCQFIQQMKSVLKSVNRHRIKTGEYVRMEG
ncbi:hypothetical protein LGI69_003638 [Salmonella enterica]|nr:hypothetical protein [Salmonella enterica]EBW8396111.1 hypothetical protein [Salmonella enterica subsp. enterica serovar Florida]ECL4900646.1 hypothetical protein [Salmonella enterica]EEM2237963.1 hypothetical protein [Salmonella enterica]EIH3276567.1 hypothetical protein [Salmonella enterica]